MPRDDVKFYEPMTLGIAARRYSIDINELTCSKKCGQCGQVIYLDGNWEDYLPILTFICPYCGKPVGHPDLG